jgi:hypothetical protein
MDEAVARQLVNYAVARNDKADGAKIGGLVGRMSIYLALVGPVFDSMDYAAARATNKEARTASLLVKPEADVTISALRSAEVPAACSMPRQRLVDNKTTKPGKNVGPSGQLALDDPKPKFADIAGRGYRQAVSYYICSAGGVGWPPVVILTGQGGKLLGYVDFGDLTQRAYGDRGRIEDLAVDNNAVTVGWSSSSGCCSALAEHRSVLEWRNSALVVKSDTITQWSADGVAFDIASAAVAGERARLLDSSAVPDDVWRSLVAAGAGAEEGFVRFPFDGEDTNGDLYRYELTFAFGDTDFVTWDVWMTSASNRYGWRMVSATPQ